MDASKLGAKVKEDGKNQKTVLRPEEINQIIDTFNSAKPVDDFCVVVDYEDIKAKKLSFSAGQYFETQVVYSELTPEQFEERISYYRIKLSDYFSEARKLETDIFKALESLKYDL